jgi:YebC/PmpR family DNA-binding regulatory protein
VSGHSKWAKIKRTKGLVDIKKGAELSRASKDIINAVRIGGSPDVDFNPMLRVAIDKAKAINMTNDRIERAINRGNGGVNSGDQKIFENTYEAYGPSGSALLIDIETDNPNRTLTDIKTVINKNGGKMANEGSISWQFKEVGMISLQLSDFSLQKKEQITEKLMDIVGVEDIEESDEEIIIIINKLSFREALNSIISSQDKSFEIAESKLIKKCDNLIEIDEENGHKLMDLIEKIEEISEVTGVCTNVK